MRKSLYTALAALALLGGAGALTVSALGESSPSVQGVDLELTPKYFTVNGSVKIDVANKRAYPHLEFELPTEGRDDNYTYQPLTVITNVVVQRLTSYSDPNPVTIYDKTNRTPGEKIEVDDLSDDLEKGKEYTYKVFAYVGERYYSTTEYVTAGITPVYPSQISCVSTDGENPVVITVTCPAKEYGNSWSATPFPEGVEYTSLNFYVVDQETREDVLIHAVENPVAGEEYTFSYTDAKPGMNNFKFRADTDFGNSGFGYANAYIGLDFPAAPTGMAAVAIDDYVKVSWNASKSYNGGKFDPAEVEYTVYRNDNSEYEPGTYKEVWKELGKTHECEFIDNLEDLTEETSVKYMVRPDNGVEPTTSYITSTSYPAIVVGPPAPLPYIETFNKGTKFSKTYCKSWDQNFSWNSFSDYYVRYGKSITLSDGSELDVPTGAAGGNADDDEGCDNYLYVTPNSWYTDSNNPGYMTSGKISLKDAENPYVSFCYVPVTGSSGSVTVEIYTGEKDEEENPIFNEVKMVKYDEEFEIPQPEEAPVMRAEGENEPAAGIAEPWERVYVSLADYAGSESCKIRFKFQYLGGSYRPAMMFDEVRIEDYPAASDLAIVKEENSLKLNWTLAETALDKKPAFNVYLNGGETPVATVVATEYVYDNIEEGETYNFAVETVYPDNIIAPNKAEASFSVPVTAFTVDGVNYTVDGENAEAVGVAEDAATVTIPATVAYKETTYNVTMGSQLFSGNTVVENVTIALPIENLGAETFYGATALKSVTLPASVVKIDEKAFFGCVALAGIELPAGLMSIENSAFENCTALTSMVFGENVVKIGDRAFCNCSQLAEVTFKGSVPPAVGADAFKGIASPCQGSCPDGTLDEYLSVENLNPITFEGAGIAGVNIDEAVSVEYFTLSGARIAEPTDGQPVIVRARYANGEVKVGKLLRSSRK